MRASFVDRLLAQLDGAVAPIWITELLVTPAPPAVAALREAVAQLVVEVERLRMQWDPAARGWTAAPASRTVDVTVHPPEVERVAVARLLAARVDLTREAPLRIHLVPLADAPGATLLALQLHHAVGDARSLMFLNRRLWQLLAGAPGQPLDRSLFDDRLALLAAGRHAKALGALAFGRNRVLARRGAALRRSGDQVGAPMLRSLRVPLEGSPQLAAELFFAALLAGIARHGVQDRRAPVRLRVPVDLRRELGLGRAVENPCSAVPIEIPWDEVAAARDPRRLARGVLEKLAGRLRDGGHWATLVECMAVTRLASLPTLRSHTRPELLAARRGSTLVTTYVGTVDRWLAECPFPVLSLRTHTPTWGANAMTLGGALVMNVSAFEGLWRPDELEAFVDAMRAPFTAAGLPSEVM